MNIDPEQIVRHLEKLVNIPSPTGHTEAAAEHLIDFAKSKGIDYRVTKKGAVIYELGGKDVPPKVAFAAHIDTLGAMVRGFKDNVVRIAMVGGYPPIYVVGETCTVGDKYRGTILPNNPAAHVNKKLADDKVEFDNLWVRLDCDLRQSSESDGNGLRDLVSVGDYVSLDPRFEYVEGFVKSRHLDDKASVAILLAIAEMYINSFPGTVDQSPAAPCEIIFNVTEETGQGLAGLSSSIEELVVVDMGVVGDGVEGDEFSVSICAKDSSGPYHEGLTRRLIDLAKQNSIGFKIDVFPYYGSDGSAALRAGSDLKVALIGPGVSASHGYERTHREGLANTFGLIWEYLQSCN